MRAKIENILLTTFLYINIFFKYDEMLRVVDDNNYFLFDFVSMVHILLVLKRIT